MKSEQVRNLRKKFREETEQNHKEVQPCSLVPSSQDKTVIFNTSGMQQLVPYLTGKEHPLGKRLFNIQRCVRTNDIEDIGDERHLSMFEMMGNRSLGNYFKKESLKRSIHFLTKELQIPIEKIGATIFIGGNGIAKDLEAKEILLANGISPDKIRELDEDNFRGPPGAVGPCGPCCEIFVDRGEAYGPADRNIGTNDRYTEVWNNVFMEFYKDDQGNYTKLKQQNVDTGMGLERLCMFLQNKETIFETDIFEEIIKTIEKNTESTYPAYNQKEEEWGAFEKRQVKSFRIVCDHIRASCFLLMDGVIPSNEGRGYVLRRLIRRMYYHTMILSNEKKNGEGKTLSFDEIKNLVTAIVSKFSSAYPELIRQSDSITKELSKEIENFKATIKRGEKQLNDILDGNEKKIISGAEAFTLYDSYGFPVELTIEIAKMQGIEVDLIGFEKELEKAREKSRSGASSMFKKTVDRAQFLEGIPTTEFVGYHSEENAEMKLLKKIELEENTVLIFDKTPFYAQGGGQTGDFGTIVDNDGTTYQISDVQKYEGVFLHFIKK
ncbi:MAG TPA: alanine--tRNA ligase [Candidatus Absconditabacterales bacterium]|nr:alanine--tRNA ligase [Candidatus Absconditabacterales bacterium]